MVEACLADGELPDFPVGLEGLSTDEGVGEEPAPRGAPAVRHDADEGGGEVAAIHGRLTRFIPHRVTYAGPGGGSDGIEAIADDFFLKDLAVPEVAVDAQGEAGEGKLGAVLEAALRDCMDGFHTIARSLDHGEFHLAREGGVVHGLAFIDGHLGLFAEKSGEQLADEHEKDAGVDEHHASFTSTELEARAVSGEKVHNEKAAEQGATGQWNDKFSLPRHDIPPSDPRPEEKIDDFMNSQRNLRDGADENENHR